MEDLNSATEHLQLLVTILNKMRGTSLLEDPEIQKELKLLEHAIFQQNERLAIFLQTSKLED